MKPLEPHPLASIFPPMMPEEYESLKSDIERNGLLHPIVVHEGRILDGIHRHIACEELGIKIKSIPFKELGYNGTPEEYVLSENLHRRHLTIAQRACLGIPLYEKRIKEHRSAALKLGWESRRKGNPPKADKNADRSSAYVAKLVGVGIGVMSRILGVKKRRPDLIGAILKNKKVNGKILTINTASKLAGTCYRANSKPRRVLESNGNASSKPKECIAPVDMFTATSDLISSLQKVNDSENHRIEIVMNCYRGDKAFKIYKDSSLRRIMVSAINACVKSMNDKGEKMPAYEKV